MDKLLLVVVAALVAAFLYALTRSLASWRGAWRIGAASCLLGVTWVVARAALDVRKDPSSHSLWPLEILFAVFVASVALAVLHLARRARGTRSPR